MIGKHERRRKGGPKPLKRVSVRLDRLESRYLDDLSEEFQLELFSPHIEDIGYDELLQEPDFEGFPEEFLTIPGQTVTILDGDDLSHVFEVFVHAPFKDDSFGDRNDCSLAFQISLYNGNGCGRALLMGDLSYPVIRRIFDCSEPVTVQWNALLAPHHCSKSVMYWKDDGEEDETLKDDMVRDLGNAALDPGYVVSTTDPGDPFVAHITLDCSGHERVEGGLRLLDREGITLWIPADFPFSPPAAFTAHTRFHGFSHVQWGNCLCLYSSPDTQWNPSRGMFGLVAQLDEWLRRSARNELDHPEGPLHPPIAYTVSSTAICVNADTPDRSHWPWFGAAMLTRTKPDLLEVDAWQPVYTVPNDVSFAPTVLLDFELPYEYPRTVHHLLLYLEIKGVPSSRVLAHLMLASERVSQGAPLYVGIGTPSRGVAGDLSQRRQHLTFWEIEPSDVTKLRDASFACDISNHYRGRETPEQIQALIDSVWQILISWRSEARVRWCQVFENRPEIITRRDKGTAVDWFHGKRVALWGCGAIGGLIAEHLARAGAGELTLYDQARVTPGVLVRQNFSAIDTNDAKVEALARRLHAVAPGLKVTTRAENIISQTLNRSDWDADIDIVIDATASLRVRSKLEVVLKDHQPRVPVAAIMISPTAQYAVAVSRATRTQSWTPRRASSSRPHGPQSTLAEQLGTCLLDKRRQHSSPPARTGMLRSNVRRLACRRGQLFRPSTECVGRPTNRARRHRQRLPLLPVARSRPTRYPVSSRHSLGGRRDRLPHVGQRVAGHDRLDSRRGTRMVRGTRNRGIAFRRLRRDPRDRVDHQRQWTTAGQHVLRQALRLRNGGHQRPVPGLQRPHTPDRALRRNLALPSRQPGRAQPDGLRGHRHHLRHSRGGQRASVDGDCRTCCWSVAANWGVRVRETRLGCTPHRNRNGHQRPRWLDNATPERLVGRVREALQLPGSPIPAIIGVERLDKKLRERAAGAFE